MKNLIKLFLLLGIACLLSGCVYGRVDYGYCPPPHRAIIIYDAPPHYIVHQHYPRYR